MSKTPQGGTENLVTHPPFVGKRAPLVEDVIALAWREYQRQGGTLSAMEWHDKLAPKHRRCSSCQ